MTLMPGQEAFQARTPTGEMLGRDDALAAAPPSSAAVSARPGADVPDWRTDTMVDALRRRAARQPEMVLYTYLEDGESRESSLTAAALDAAARAIGRTLAKLAAPGTRVILLFEDGLDTIQGLFGCFAAGLVAVSGIHPSAPRSTERLLGILRDSKATVVLGQARVLAEFQRALDDMLDAFDLRWVASDMIKPGSADGWRATPAANDGLALIQYTSGSTRDPRGVMLTHRNLLHNLQGQIEAYGYRSGDTAVSWLPFSHDMGMIGCVLMAVFGGGHCVLLSPSHFVEDPSRWLKAIARYRATISGGPNFAYDLCARRAQTMDLGALDLSAWAVAVSGAEPVRADVLRRFVEAFGVAGFRAEALRPSYGLAEATLLVACGPRLSRLETRIFDQASLQANRAVPIADQATEDGIELVGCGQPFPDQTVAIVDPATNGEVAAGEIGEIWIAGPSISAGYWERPDDNLAYFSGDLGDGRGPFLRSGDLGFMRGGELFITGRLRDLLVIRGKNYYPQDLEHAAEASHPAVRPGSSACFLTAETGDLVIVCELIRTPQADAAEVASAIRATVTRHHGINPARVVLAGWGAVMKTPSGKIQRSQTRSAYADGQLSVVHEAIVAPTIGRAPQHAEVVVDMGRIEEWFVAKMGQLGIDLSGFDPKARLTELGFDSLKIVELKADLERDLKIVIPIADLFNFENIQDLADHLRAEARRHEGSEPSDHHQRPVAAPAVRPASRLAGQRRIRALRDATSAIASGSRQR